MTATTLPLRPYQREALYAIDDEWIKGVRRTAVVLPTGMGKTVIFADLARQTVLDGGRVLVLVHRDELVRQAVDKLHSVYPTCTPGVVKASRNEWDWPIVVASVQTLSRQSRLDQVPRDQYSLVIVDECHHAAAVSYRRVLDRFDRARAVGFTATMHREDNRGLGDVWESIAYTRGVLYGIEQGYLTDVRGQVVTLDGLNLAMVARSRGDYQDGDLGEAMSASEAGKIIADAYQEYAPGRQGIMFTPTVATAREWAGDLVAKGIPAETITGDTSIEDRQLIYKRFRERETQVLSSCMVLTEGFDMPQAEVAVVARPTQSPGLYVQMVGRVLRPWPGKSEALVLDVVGVTEYHRLATLTELVKSTVREVRPGETLRQAADREAGERVSGVVIRPDGDLTAKEVDLFHRSRSAWLQTKKGLWFIPAGEWVYFLWPESSGLVTVGRTLSKGKHTPEKLHDGVTLEYGMAWAEEDSRQVGGGLSMRTASWRRGKPSESQVDLCARMGIEIPEGARRGAVSDLISIAFTSRLLDKYLR